MDISAFPKATERRNKQIGFDNSGMPTLLDPVETGALGYVLVDSFEEGALITSRYQALHFKSQGEFYRWDGDLPKPVPAGSTPQSTGGIGKGAWVSVGDASLRSELPPENIAWSIKYEEFKLIPSIAKKIQIINHLFVRDATQDKSTDSNPVFTDNKLYIFTQSGAAYRFVDRGERSINCSALGNAVQIAIDYVSGVRAFGGEVYVHEDVTITGHLNIKERVTLVGSGLNEIKTLHDAKSHHAVIYLKDYSKIKDIRVCGSDFMSQAESTMFTCFNKIGITTQGAVSGRGIEIDNVGFSQITNSACFVFDRHHDIDIHHCYTYGNMPAFYVNFNSDGLVTDWNANRDTARLNAKTQCYSLTNFYNSGIGVYDVTIRSNRLKNICDSAFAVNGTSSHSHRIYDNTSVKTQDGYYGGFGLDFNGGANNLAWGNEFEGHGVGAFYHDSAYNNQAFGNTYKSPIGSLFESGAKGNKSYNNNVILSTFGDNSKQERMVASSGAFSVSSIRNQCSDSISQASINTASISGSIMNASANSDGSIKLTIPDHNLGKYRIIEISGVNGASNGIWRIDIIDKDNIKLIGSSWWGEYTGEGSYFSIIAGVAIGRDNGDKVTRISIDMTVEDVGCGVWSSPSQGQSQITGYAEYINVAAPTRGAMSQVNSIANMSGISSTGIVSRNLSGTVEAKVNTTQTSVIFTNQEQDVNYKILVTSSPANNNPFIISKSVTGFVIGHDSNSFIRSVDWMLVR
nr:hypothetical protein [Providencia rettgeri]